MYTNRKRNAMTGIIFSGGYAPSKFLTEFYREKDAFVIAADKGYDYALANGITPDLYVGDLDSVSHIPKQINKKIYPSQKDATDTELAVKAAVEAGCKRIVLFGGIGSRMDHTLANLFLLIPLTDAGIEMLIVNEHNRIQLVTKKADITGKKGDIISLIPLQDCTGVTTKHLAYPLKESTLLVGSTRGISNVLTAATACVCIDSGSLLVIESRD